MKNKGEWDKKKYENERTKNGNSCNIISCESTWVSNKMDQSPTNCVFSGINSQLGIPNKKAKFFDPCLLRKRLAKLCKIRIMVTCQVKALFIFLSKIISLNSVKHSSKLHWIENKSKQKINEIVERRNGHCV